MRPAGGPSEQVWGRAAVAELRDRLARRRPGRTRCWTLLEDELMRPAAHATAGLGLVRRTSGVIAATRRGRWRSAS
ncbi:hypothetical protein GCM10020218_027680 [Dactylosporangium vinaceum]